LKVESAPVETTESLSNKRWFCLIFSNNCGYSLSKNSYDEKEKELNPSALNCFWKELTFFQYGWPIPGKWAASSIVIGFIFGNPLGRIAVFLCASLAVTCSE